MKLGYNFGVFFMKFSFVVFFEGNYYYAQTIQMFDSNQKLREIYLVPKIHFDDFGGYKLINLEFWF